MYNIYEAYVGVYNYKRVIIWKVIKKYFLKKRKTSDVIKNIVFL